MADAKFRFTVACFAFTLASCGGGSGGSANNVAAGEQPNGVEGGNDGAVTTAPFTPGQTRRPEAAEQIGPRPPVSDSDAGDAPPIAPPASGDRRSHSPPQGDQPQPATEDEYIRSDKQTDPTPPPPR